MSKAFQEYPKWIVTDDKDPNVGVIVNSKEEEAALTKGSKAKAKSDE